METLPNNNQEKLNLFPGILIADKTGAIQLADVELHKLFFYDEGSLVGKNLEEIFNPEIILKIEQLINRKQDQSDKNIISLHGIRNDNSIINCRINLIPLIDEKRDLILMQIVDIDRLQALERKIFEYNSHFLRMANKLPGVVYKLQIHPEVKVLYISDGIKNISGYDPTAFFGENALNWLNLIHKDDHARVMDSRKTQLDNLRQWDINYRVFRKDGSICWVKDQGTGIFDNKGNLITLQGNILDITNMKKYQYSNYANILDFEDSLKSRISSSINDNLHQILALSMMNLNEMENEISSLPRKSVRQFKIGLRYLNQAIRESRKISYELIPKSIRDFGLVPAIEDLLLIWKDSLTENIDFSHNMDGIRLPAFHENSIFIILREILDLLKKQKSPGPVKINLHSNSGNYIFSVESVTNGRWDLREENYDIPLKVIKKRVQAFQGEFSVNEGNNNYIKFVIQAPLKKQSHETY